MTRKLRIGLAGTGWVAHQHMAGIAAVASDVTTVTAACDPNVATRDAFCDRFDVRGRYDTATEMIESGVVDAILLLTPPAVRSEVIRPALDRGVHVLVEKPFAATGAEAAELAAASDAANVTMAVSQNFRWFPEYTWLRERTRREDMQDVTFLEARSFQNRPQNPDVWRADEARLEMAIFSVHLIDRLTWLAPTKPVSVRALTRRRPGSGLAGEQFSSLLVEFAGGVVGSLTSSWMSARLPANSFRIDAAAGSARVERTLPMSGDAHGVAHVSDEPERMTFAERTSGEHAALSYGSSVREFAEAIRDAREPAHSARDNLHTMGLMSAAYTSASRGGSVVTVEEALYGHTVA